MADSTTKPFAIYRLTTGSETEVALANKEAQGFDYGLTESSEIGVTGFTIGVPQRKTDVPNVGERSSAKPSTGLVVIPITINFTVNEKSQANPKPIAKFLYWSLEDQTVRGTMPHGRFCLRNDSFTSIPEIRADGAAGIKFVDFEVEDKIEWSNHQEGTIQLEYVGTYTGFIAALVTIIGV